VLFRSTWPRITSSTSSALILASAKAFLIAAAPSSCAGVLAKAPLKDPIAVRAAATITVLLIIFLLFCCSLFLLTFVVRCDAPLVQFDPRCRAARQHVRHRFQCDLPWPAQGDLVHLVETCTSIGQNIPEREIHATQAS